MAAKDPPNVLPPDTDWDYYQTPIYILLGVLLAVATLSQILRHYGRWKTNNKTGLDDWFALVTLLLMMVHASLAIMVAKYGSGWDPTRLPYEHRKVLQISLYTGPPVVTTLGATSKVSVLWFYRRIFGVDRTFRVSFWIVLGLTVAWWFASVMASLFQCIPISSAYNIDVKKEKCINFLAFALGTNISNGILDLLVAATALCILRKIRITATQKLYIAAMFILGSFAAVTVFLTAGITYNPRRYERFAQARWLIIQNASHVVCANFVTYGPILPKRFPWLESISNRMDLSLRRVFGSFVSGSRSASADKSKKDTSNANRYSRVSGDTESQDGQSTEMVPPGEIAETESRTASTAKLAPKTYSVDGRSI